MYQNFPQRNGTVTRTQPCHAPWYEVAVNLIGLWTAKTDQFNGEFDALTCIDTTTNLIELALIDNKSSDAIARKFENTWLAWYPRPA